MIFNSLHFLGFCSIVFPLYFLLPWKKQNRFLLIASYCFYGWWDWRFLFLILTSTTIDFIVAKKIHLSNSIRLKKYLLMLSVISNLGILGFFKYFNFFAETAQSIMNTFGMHIDSFTINVILPVGISFYTFQTLSYTIDVYRGRQEPSQSYFDFALFVSFFPQLVAGPIERAEKLLPQLTQKREYLWDNFREGGHLIAWGFFQKIFMADNLSRVVDFSFANWEQESSLSLLLASFAFSFQIYGDFAGYSNIAVGTAKCLGIDLSTNFRFPYFAVSPRDLWRRWHITLSYWVRDYIYIPLNNQLNNRDAAGFISFALMGLWHGADWTFVSWGILHGTWLVLYNHYDKSRFQEALKAHYFTVPKIIICFGLWNFITIFFRADSVIIALEIMGKILAIDSSMIDNGSLITLWNDVLFYVLPVLILELIQFVSVKDNYPLTFNFGGRILLYIALFYLTILYGAFGGHEYYYYQF